jgi:gliding motility-associated-like protein
MSRYLKLFLVIGSLLLWNHADASHMMGGDIAYECISPGKYKLVLKIYRDCRGIPFNSPQVDIFCAGGVGTSLSLDYTRTAINDVSPKCAGAPGPCTPTNVTSGEGIEEHVFEGIIDFNTSPFKALKDAGCCEIMISIQQQARNTAITTGFAGNNFYTDAMINICNIAKTSNKCNTSPQISIPPVGYACCNQSFTYNNGVKEIIDGDSLSYDLGTPLVGNNINGNYGGNFNSQIPMTPYCPPTPGKVDCRALPNAKPPRGFYFDKETGDIVFTPTNCDEVGIIVIVITEWRKDSANKWVKIGFTRRDMQIVVQQCAENNPPYFSGTNKYSVCEGNKICFTLKTTDEPYLPKQTRLDTIELTWNYGIPGATFRIIDPTAREKEAEFCWQTKIGDARPNPYTFTATAKDDNCNPRPASANRGYNVTVKPKARDNRKYDLLACGKLKFNALITSDTLNYKSRNYTFKYTIRDSTNSGVPLYMTYSKTDSFKFKRGGKYIIEHEINNPPLNCPSIYTDTVIIPPVFDVELAFGKDTFVCAGNSLTLAPLVAYGYSPYKYKWEAPVGTFNPKDTFDKFTIKPTADIRIALQMTDRNKCVDRDTINIHYQPNPVVNIGPDQRICTYQNVTLDAQNADTMRYYWQPNGDSTRKITINIAGRYIAKVIDKLGCNTSDTMMLFVNDTVVALAGPDREICINDTLKVKGQRRPKGYTRAIQWKDLLTGATLSNDSAFATKIIALTARNYEMYLKVTQGTVTCEDKDTFNLIVNDLPKFTYTPPAPRCYADGAINLTTNKVASTIFNNYRTSPDSIRYFMETSPNWVTGGPVGINTFVLDFPKFITNAQLPKNGLTMTICYDYKNPKGCYNKECKPVKLNPNPVVELNDGVFCQKAGEINVSKLVAKPFSKVGGIESFRIIDVPAGSGVDPMAIIRTDFSVPPVTWVSPGVEGENEKTGDYILEYCFKDVITGCQSCDTSTVSVIRLPEIQFSSLPKQCINNPPLALDSFVRDRNSGKRFPNGTWMTVAYGGSRDMSNPNTKNKILNSIKDGKHFDPSLGAGQYLLKLTDVSSGCPVSDSAEIQVNGLPIIQIDIPDTVCSSSSPFTLVNIQPSGTVGVWSGNGVTGRDFDPAISAKSKQYEGPVMIKFAFTNPLTGCSASDSQSLLIQTQPEIAISNTKPYQQCENATFTVNGVPKWAKNVIWSTASGDGTFSAPNAQTTVYKNGLNDTALNGLNGNIPLTVSTVKEGVCPVAKDNITLIYEPFPIFSMPPHVVACEGRAIFDFSADVSKPAGSANLRYTWDMGNSTVMDRSTVAAPKKVTYDTAKQGWYNVSVTVHNQWGSAAGQSCDTRKDSIDYVRVLPQPKAAFSSDPPFFTTVAFPKFRFFNETKLRWGQDSMSYLWNFDQRDIDDTSTQFSPIHSYSADTFTYWVNLQASYHYHDAITMADSFCTDSIGQARKIGPDVTVFVPTGFSPEGTGPRVNNRFMPVVNGEKTYYIQLYNRWGELLWETADKFASWDGKYQGEDAQQDVYAWVIKVTAFDGEEYRYEGTVTLIR